MPVTITGPDIAALIAQANATIIEQSEVALDTVAEATQVDAKDNCPVDTGALQADIQVYPSTLERDIGNLNIYYAIYVHNGTWKMKARPYLFNAFEANKDKLVPLLQSMSI